MYREHIVVDYMISWAIPQLVGACWAKSNKGMKSSTGFVELDHFLKYYIIHYVIWI